MVAFVSNFDIFEPHKSYENMIMKLVEKGKIQPTLNEFYQKI